MTRTVIARWGAALVAGAALSVAGVGWAPASHPPGRPAAVQLRVIRLTIHHSRFRPAHLSVRVGTFAKIVVRNTDPIDHELIFGDQSVQDRHERGTATSHHSPGAVSVRADSATETVYTFLGPAPILFGCHLPGHWAYGMRGTVTLVN